MVTVVCPIYNEEKYIRQCIDSILLQDYPKDDLEVIFVDGMSTDKTRDIVLEYIARCPFIRLVDNPKRIVPCAMNIGIVAAKGDVIMRLDAHSNYPKNYISVLVRRLFELEADNVGVVCRTDVLNKTPKSLAIKEVLGNKFGVGNSTFRIGIDKVSEVDTVPFGCWKRDVFKKYGMYNEKLIRNQDIELNKRILRGGGKIFIVPDTYCTYLARETYSGLSKNNFANGKWNILTLYYTHQLDSISPRHLIPLFFVLSLIIPFLGGFLWHPLWYVAIASLFCYLLALGSVSLHIAIKKKLNIVYLLLGFIVIHLSYGLGSFMGLLNLPFLKNNR